MSLLSLALVLHLLAVVIWVGGMFFAHMALRPAANELLEPAQRLPLMLTVFDRFFPWVWGSVIVLLVTGFWVFLGVFQGKVGVHVHIMSTVGLVMSVIFAFIYFLPYRKMGSSIEAGDLAAAGKSLALIRKLILTNLLLGMSVSALGLAGRYL